MKGMTKKTLGREVASMYDFVNSLKKAEDKQAALSLDDFGFNMHDHKGDAFTLVRNYMIDHFRPLV